MRMKRSLRFGGSLLAGVVLSCLMLAVSGCSTAPTAQAGAEKTPPKTPLKVGFYVDNGSQGAGVIQLARIIEYSPQLQLVPLVGKDLRNGALQGLDLLVVPGGSSEKQYVSMQEAGAEAVRRFVAAGGAYYGICAGYHCALNRPRRIGLLPYTLLEKHHGARAVLGIDLSEKGAEVLGIPKGYHEVTYSHGPIATPAEQPGTGWGEELATYKNYISHPKNAGVNFAGRPAILRGEYGKGKVIATSFHPEYLASTRPFAYGCIQAVTGVRPAPVWPVKNFRPLRVGYYCATIIGKASIDETLELDRQPDLDMFFISSFDDGILEHLDVLIFPEGRSDSWAAAAKRPRWKPMLRAFLERGGRIVAVGRAAQSATEHPNVIRVPERSGMLEAVRAAGRAE